MVKQFHSFVQSLGAVRSSVIESPFILYELKSHSLLFHVIDFSTYHEAQIDSGFLMQCFTQANIRGYKIISIWEDVVFNKYALVEARILAMLGKRKRIHARQTVVVRLDKKAATDFLNENHLQGSTGAYYKFGLMHEEKLVAVATFSKARTMYDGPVYYKSYELERFASKQGITVAGGLSKLLKYFTDTFHAKHIMTYADADWSQGEGYLKLGFHSGGYEPPQKFLIDTHHLIRFKDGLNDKSVDTNNLLMIHNSGSIKFIMQK